MAVLEDVKNALGVTGDYQDNTLNQYITEVQEFLKDAGVPLANQTSGVIARGVADLWNYGAGEGKLSQYFIMRASQLALRK
ncbi:phage head-tail connector protein [uncultured Methanobrevibacter sp.]|uniref:phage head-tail connector protein n=1 Tax=uncultured Methanobrevibacter sp. TaxID=253161 RepID=UPI0026184B87|nr:phage head-tail connector protein [uncultured Methanobrevibacter sp.]